MSGDSHPPWFASCTQLVEDPIDHRLEIDPLVSKRVVVKLQALQLDAELVWDVLKIDSREVRIARLRANAREFRACVRNRVVPLWLRVRKSLDIRHLWREFNPEAWVGHRIARPLSLQEVDRWPIRLDFQEQLVGLSATAFVIVKNQIEGERSALP